jgi:hypothetical protein
MGWRGHSILADLMEVIDVGGATFSDHLSCLVQPLAGWLIARHKELQLFIQCRDWLSVVDYLGRAYRQNIQRGHLNLAGLHFDDYVFSSSMTHVSVRRELYLRNLSSGNLSCQNDEEDVPKPVRLTGDIIKFNRYTSRFSSFLSINVEVLP